VVERLGSKWKLAPQFGDLTDVEGGFSTALGKFWAKWSVGPQFSGGYRLEFKMPKGTVGDVVLPFSGGRNISVTVRGKETFMGLSKMVGGGMGFSDVEGGSHYVIIAN